MEAYNEFINRISAFEKEELSLGSGDFTANKSVSAADENDKFSPFYGDTVVFRLGDCEINEIAMFINELYAQNECCFCERLPNDTLHMTLHDLSNSPYYDDIADKLPENESRLREITKGADISFAPVKMRCKAIFNMVSTSLVLGLYPDSETDHHRLMRLYETVDVIYPLSYPFTPHITLAYFSRNGFDAEKARSLEHTVNELNTSPAMKKLTVMLDPDKLYYQHFINMKYYTDIFKL